MSLRLAERSVGMRAARAALRRIEALGADRSELSEAIGQTLVESAVQRLAVTNRGPDGAAWPVSARARARGGRTQFDTGQAGLAGSILYNVIPDGIEVGSPLVYAAQRQFGGTIKAKPGKSLVFDTIDEETGEEITIFAAQVTQPARPYLGISDEDGDEISALTFEFLDDILAAADGGRA